MSKSYPGTARKYDLYVATEELLDVGRVLFIGQRRFVIRERMKREEWNTERAIPPDGGFADRIVGVGFAEDQPSDRPPPGDAANPPEIPLELAHFYGADYI